MNTTNDNRRWKQQQHRDRAYLLSLVNMLKPHKEKREREREAEEEEGSSLSECDATKRNFFSKEENFLCVSEKKQQFPLLPSLSLFQCIHSTLGKMLCRSASTKRVEERGGTIRTHSHTYTKDNRSWYWV